MEGIVELMLDATQNYDLPLTDERLFGWQAALFPTGRSGTYGITVGDYRPGIVRVVSGPMGTAEGSFRGPPGIPGTGATCARFIDWFNRSLRY